MWTIYAIIYGSFAHLVYKAFWIKQHYEQAIYLALTTSTILILPLLHIEPVSFFLLHGFVNGFLVQDTLVGDLIIKNVDISNWTSSEKWTCDQKSLLHGFVASMTYCVVGCVSVGLLNYFSS